ncbi:MAG: Abi family protein [Eggerthellales bacterium]|nr:Abi family protein [Eggerthellales bacterium]
MEKPFKTIDEQIAILRARGMDTDDRTRGVLEREGYYPVVNGYKDPFIDPWATGMAGDDRFRRGSSFSDLYVLFCFDRELRSLFLKYAAMAEATLKTVCSYCFTQEHPDEVNPYLNREHYSARPEDRSGVDRLIVEMEKALGVGDARHRYRRSYLKHYMENHGGEVPLWVLMNYLMFGQAFKFYSYQSAGMRNKIAKSFSALYAESHEHGKRIDPRSLRLAYDHIKDFRNICAHDERFYCARVAKAGDVTVRALCADLEMVLTSQSHRSLMREACGLVERTEEALSMPVGVAGMMGWRDLEELRSAVG